MIDSLSSPTAAPAKGVDTQKLKQTAQQFEAVFLRQMISSMRTAGPGDGLFDSSATEQFRDMSDARVADEMAKKGGFGITEMLMRHYGAKDAAAPAVDPAR